MSYKAVLENMGQAHQLKVAAGFLRLYCLANFKQLRKEESGEDYKLLLITERNLPCERDGHRAASGRHSVEEFTPFLQYSIPTLDMLKALRKSFLNPHCSQGAYDLSEEMAAQWIIDNNPSTVEETFEVDAELFAFA